VVQLVERQPGEQKKKRQKDQAPLRFVRFFGEKTRTGCLAKNMEKKRKMRKKNEKKKAPRKGGENNEEVRRGRLKNRKKKVKSREKRREEMRPPLKIPRGKGGKSGSWRAPQNTNPGKGNPRISEGGHDVTTNRRKTLHREKQTLKETERRGGLLKNKVTLRKNTRGKKKGNQLPEVGGSGAALRKGSG